MATNKYMLDRVVAGAVTFKGCANLRIDPGIEAALDAGASVLDPALRCIMAVRPMYSFSTPDLKTLCDAAWSVGVSDYLIPHIPVAAGATCAAYFQRRVGAVAGAAGTNHKLLSTKGVIRIDRISGSPVAIAECSVYADFDGTNAPIVHTVGQDLPGGSAGATEKWRPAAIVDDYGGTPAVIHKIRDFSIDFGVSVGRQQPGNSYYAVDTAITGFRPSAEFSTEDCAEALDDSGPVAGATAGTNGLALLFAKYDADGVGIETTTALAFAFRVGSPFWPTSIPFGGGGPLAIAYRVLGKGGTAAQPPLAYSSGNTLPTESVVAGFFGVAVLAHNTTEYEYVAGEFDPGLNWRLEPPSGSLLWPDNAYIVDRRRTLRFSTLDADLYQSIGNRLAISTAFNLYLRKFAANSMPEADASVKHVKIALTAGDIEWAGLGGAHGETVPGDVIVTGLGAVCTFTKESAITLA